MTRISRFLLAASLCALLCDASFAFASTTNGTIDSVYKYAWGDKMGWINFVASSSNVAITDSAITGYAWNANYGWINLSPTQSGVKNDGEGNLSGSAWSAGLGWINFSGVKINTAGYFTGTASSSVAGTLSFNCTNCKVTTDWRPVSERAAMLKNGSNSGGSGGGGGSGGSGGGGPYVPFPTSSAPVAVSSSAPNATSSLFASLSGALKSAAGGLSSFLSGLEEFFTGHPTSTPALPPVPIVGIPPNVFRGQWSLLPAKRIGAFVLAPLPQNISFVLNKFPEVAGQLKQVGVTHIADITKLAHVTLHLPPITQSGGLTLPRGTPITLFSRIDKGKIPTGIVFAQFKNEKFSYDTQATLVGNSNVHLNIETIVGMPVHLSVKPDAPVQSVKGFLVLKSINAAQREVGMKSLDALLASTVFTTQDILKFSALFGKGNANGGRVAQALNTPRFVAPPISVNTLGFPFNPKQVLETFDYSNPTGDGIYTADISAPGVEGQFQIVTQFVYADPARAPEETSLNLLTDPEGYIYEKDGDKEIRIPGTVISLYALSLSTNKYELWDAKSYSQVNPQVTDVRGTYSFLVPDGWYELTLTAPGYGDYTGKPFQVVNSSGPVNANIELKTPWSWLGFINWQTAMLALVIILLWYNFYKDRKREGATRISDTDANQSDTNKDKPH